jgi:hypothetical protein
MKFPCQKAHRATTIISFTEAKNNLYHKGLKTLFKVKQCFQGHSPKIKTILHISDHTIKPILLYGSEIWGSFPAQKLLTQGDNYIKIFKYGINACIPTFFALFM